jgi:hypothetical protein
VVTRTGSAVAVALRGRPDAPVFLGRWELDLAPGPLPVQPYHEAAGLPAPQAHALIDAASRAAEDAAAGGLERAVAMLPAAVTVTVAVVVKPYSLPDDLVTLLRSHPRQHAGEGVLYREAVLGAARRLAWTAVAVDQAALPAAAQVVAMIGQAAGRPWRGIEKDACRAALTQLA